MNTRCCWAWAFLSFSLTNHRTSPLHAVAAHTPASVFHYVYVPALWITMCVCSATWTHILCLPHASAPHTHTRILAHFGHALLCLLLSSFLSFFLSLLHTMFPYFSSYLFVFLFLASAESAIFPAVFTDFTLFLSSPLPLCLSLLFSHPSFISSAPLFFAFYPVLFSCSLPLFSPLAVSCFTFLPLSSSPLPISHVPVSLSLLFVFSSLCFTCSCPHFLHPYLLSSHSPARLPLFLPLPGLCVCLCPVGAGCVQ